MYVYTNSVMFKSLKPSRIDFPGKFGLLKHFPLYLCMCTPLDLDVRVQLLHVHVEDLERQIIPDVSPILHPSWFRNSGWLFVQGTCKKLALRLLLNVLRNVVDSLLQIKSPLVSRKPS